MCISLYLILNLLYRDCLDNLNEYENRTKSIIDNLDLINLNLEKLKKNYTEFDEKTKPLIEDCQDIIIEQVN